MLHGEEDNRLNYIHFVLVVILLSLFLHLWKTLKLHHLFSYTLAFVLPEPTRHTFLHR